VIKHLVIAVVVAISLSACQKSTDLGRVQEESLELVKVHIKALDQLQRRADRLLDRGRAIGSKAGPNTQGIADAGRILTEARSNLDQLRAVAGSAPKAVADAAKVGEEELFKTSDEMVEKLDSGAAAVRADLDAVDQWLAIAENRPAPAAPPMPPAAPPTTPAPAPTPASAPTGTGAPAAAGSAAAPAAPSN
jgi:hypothetical protein